MLSSSVHSWNFAFPHHQIFASIINVPLSESLTWADISHLGCLWLAAHSLPSLTVMGFSSLYPLIRLHLFPPWAVSARIPQVLTCPHWHPTPAEAESIRSSLREFGTLTSEEDWAPWKQTSFSNASKKRCSESCLRQRTVNCLSVLTSYLHTHVCAEVSDLE